MPSYSQKSILTTLASLLVAGNVFFLLSTFRVREYTDTALDFQILIKLSLWFSGIGLGLLLYRNWISKLLLIDNIMIIPMFLLIFISCFMAPHPVYALASLFSIIALFMTLFTASTLLREEQILYYVFVVISLISFISIIAYFVNPEYARLGEWQDGEFAPGNRLSGITGNPNSMGLMAAFSLILGYYYRKNFANVSLPVYILCVSLCALALIMSNSRTSLAAMLVALTSGYFLQWTKHKIVAACFMFCGLVIFLLLVDLETIMSMLSRSGDAREITTATGRTHIWETSIDLIGQKPLLGWGFTSTKEILPEHAHEIGHAPQSTHNLYLQMLFTMGIPGLIFFMMMCVIKFYYAMRFQDYFKVTILIFLLLHGLTESTIFVGMAGSTTIMFGLAYCLEYRKRNGSGTDEAEDDNIPDAALG